MYESIMDKAINNALLYKSFSPIAQINNAKNIIAWGAGVTFSNIYDEYIKRYSVRIDYIVDKDINKQQHEVYGIKCISPADLLNIEDPLVIICVYSNVDAVMDFCEKNNIPWIWRSHFFDVRYSERVSEEWFINSISKIQDCFHMLNDDESKRVFSNVLYNRIGHGSNKIDYSQIKTKGEYFSPEDAYTLSNNEVFLDIGAYNGDSINEFLNIVDYKFKKVIGLEIDKNNYELCNQLCEKFSESVRKKIYLYNKGAWDSRIKVNISGEGMTTRTADGNCSDNRIAYCDRIDDFLSDDDKKSITLIKMDIEGAETNAIIGASETISLSKPKLALCVYHTMPHLYEIPLMIKALVPEYKIAIRHHSVYNSGTVMYAWI